jgi:hypothetical protein
LNAQQTNANTELNTLQWLSGTWKRTNITKPGRVQNETWKRSSVDEWVGIGVTMQQNDTVFIEKISIRFAGGILYYIADVPENKQPVYFRFTELSNNGFVCENPDHDFPKRIVYRLIDKNKLIAQVSGNGKSTDYYFERVD